MDPIGKSPISAPVLMLGKAAMVSCWLFFFVKKFELAAMLYDSALTRALGLALFAAGLALVALAFLHLGRSVSIGLPREQTELKIRGVYRLSRNPMYIGSSLMCVGACLFALHPVNFLLLAIMLGVHHRIVLKEEEFLEQRFGQRWLDYKARTPRYVGALVSKQ